MLHCGFPKTEMDRRPHCHRHNCRGNLRNWPMISSDRDRRMNMNPFMDDFMKPMNEFMAHAMEPLYAMEPQLQQTCGALNKLPIMAPEGSFDEKQEVILTPHKFQILLDVDGFKPEELAVKMTDKFITMEGKHEEKSDHSQISQSFSRKWAIPEGVKVEEINCHLNSRDGLLQLEAPRIPPQFKRLEHTYMIPIMIEKGRASPSDSTKVQYDQKELDKNSEILAKEIENMTE